MTRRLLCLLLASLCMLSGAFACPCVDTSVVRVDQENRLLLATISETSRVMVTAALWELLTTIRTDHPEWTGRWHISFFTSKQAAETGGVGFADSHVADYDRETMKLILWPQLISSREETTLLIK